ncbi:MAG: phage head spike fiber domain-containing protein [Flavobacteriaceae bacterium]
MKENNWVILALVMLLVLLSCRKGYQPPWNNESLQPINCDNLLSYTEDFFDETWYRNSVKVINNATLDPNGSPNADLIDFSSDSLESRLYQRRFDLEPGTYSFSIFLKAAEEVSSTHAIGINFEGEENSWNKSIVKINDSTWTRGEVRIKTNKAGSIAVYPAYALIKGGQANRVFAWGAQLNEMKNISPAPPSYCGKNVILGKGEGY